MVRATQHRRFLALEQLEDRFNPSHFTAAIVGAPLEGPEGTAVALSNTVTPVTAGEVINVASYAWSVTKDGTAFAAGTEANFSFTPDDNGVYVVSLTITDTAGDAGTATTTTTALNVAPTATVTGPAVVVPGQSATFTLGATDPSTADQAAGFTFNVDWNADGTVDETVTGPSGTQLSHMFTETGDVQVIVTATDKDGGVSAPATLDVGVDTVALVDDPANPGKTALFVAGTEGNDKIHFSPDGKSGGVRVRVNGVDEGTFSPTSAIVVLAGEGDDNIQVAGSIRIAARLHGEGGNDRIKAGKGGSVLDGGDGDDKLIGGNARDILIGGLGADDLNGGPGDDVLVGGSLSAETDDTAMALLLAEWKGTGDYATRVAALAATLATGVTEDGVADKLNGASGEDWFLTTDPLDQIHGQKKGEIVGVPTDDGTGDDGTGDDDGKDKGPKDKGPKDKGPKDKGGKGKGKGK